ncbi:MAG: AbrB/MazE/SpoVT family DNA-binding domain-containing protein [Proteobacteria bacterium]|nr:AbrB/MazE/SpoVT family DNA-binding domain-containing protein [Pseudomonadota bacterium]MBU4278020.1 AbrB/MazE/SpoVT family DNA-binding domain-containing protein [Pseudomonadota bacterium]MBU4381412.1 AbrB/MazE/SpoVT family DNA-binding domain-containing protein [Pseudomonadota bacterium]MBU4605619.1 AbrB/MazE/SpoVT family DNA-binding domain-containing protein [Pseudomonadota bacterium]MCG2764894.1 AbrB/MazE/SpoVT family DNA-binding domain-containing protein [Desulfarculaceae bacterium]
MARVTRVSKQGNSLGVLLPKEFLDGLGLVQGDRVAMRLLDRRIEIVRAEDDYNDAMDLGKECSSRYRRALAKLAK